MASELAVLPQALNVDEAVELVCAFAGQPRRKETAGLTHAAGRVLASPLYAPFPMPPFRRAAMDGYAVRSAETREAADDEAAALNITGQVLPGSDHLFDRFVKPMQAVRIFTGAPMPEGFDAVLMQEAASEISSSGGEPAKVRPKRACRAGEHVAEAGEDMMKGELALSGGCLIGAKEIAILASFGCSNVDVWGRPRVAVLPVGDELVPPGSRRTQNQIYEANGIMTEIRLRELGADVIRYHPVPDDPAVIETAIRRAKQAADMVITTGGISVGAYDYVAKAAERTGAVPLFRKVLMRPGKPTSAFSYDNGLMICLSGNPSACYAGLELLVKPAVLKAAGRASYRNAIIDAVLEADVKPCPVTRHVRSALSLKQGVLTVCPLGKDQAGNIAAFAQSQALAVIPPGGRGALAGDRVRVVLPDAGLFAPVVQ